MTYDASTGNLVLFGGYDLSDDGVSTWIDSVAPLILPTQPTISNLPSNGSLPALFTATVDTTGDGVKSVTSSTPSVCVVSGFAVSSVAAGTCTLTAHVGQGTYYASADGIPQSFTLSRATPTQPTITNLPSNGLLPEYYSPTVGTTGDGVKSVTSSTLSVCVVSGSAVIPVAAGTCTLTAHVGQGTNYAAADGTPQSFLLSLATPTTPTITNLPITTAETGFTANVDTTGDGTKSVTSSTPSVCTASGLIVQFVGGGTCTVTAHVAMGTDYVAADGASQSFTVYLAPTISSFTPTRGPVGTVVKIKGTNLSGAKVTIAGIKVPVISDSTTKIKVKVPAGTKTGNHFQVATPGGTVKAYMYFTIT
jgi:hypothetical protein